MGDLAESSTGDWGEEIDPRYLEALLRQAVRPPLSRGNAVNLIEDSIVLLQDTIAFRADLQSVVGRIEKAVSLGFQFDPDDIIKEIDGAAQRDKRDKNRQIKEFRLRENSSAPAEKDALQKVMETFAECFRIRFSTQIDVRKRMVALRKPLPNPVSALEQASKAFATIYKDVFELNEDLHFESEPTEDGAVLVAEIHVGDMAAEDFLEREDRALADLLPRFPFAAGLILVRPRWNDESR